MTARLRFAPSPTGYLHAGNLRTALFNFLLARQLSGQFILRLDDTDQERSRDDYALAIQEDLNWLGLTPEKIYRQSLRRERYEEVKSKLIAEGRLYPCYESPEALELRRKRLRGQGKPPVYDRAALSLTEVEKENFARQGKKPHWRFRLSDSIKAMTDGIRGQVEVDLTKVSDPIVQREDGTWLYILTSVIDDADLEITHIVRGDDHVTNSLVQLDMFDALAAPQPQFSHHNLLLGTDGEGLSKRKGDLSLRRLREQGYEPMALNALVAQIGTSKPVEPAKHLDELATKFSLSQISKAPARFDLHDLRRLNQPIVQGLSYAEATSRLSHSGFSCDERLWDTLKSNLSLFSDFEDMARPFIGDIASPVLSGEQDFLHSALACLPPAPWVADEGMAWIKALKQQSGRKGAALFKPLRLALTGREEGIDMAGIFLLLGHDIIQKRLEQALSCLKSGSSQ